MLCSWVLVTYNRRAGLVDVAWSFSIALNVIIAAWVMETAPLLVRVFLGVFSGIWFLRLTWHLLRRYANETREDTRYANMRRAMGPMLELLNIPVQQWNDWTQATVLVAGMIMLLALIGESTADQQLYRFKLNPQNQGKTLDQGLWKYSRHPNYFFEWLHWFAYPVLGLAAGVYGLWVYPLLMWLFLYYITGIPFSEQQALAHRGDNYKDYQRRTSMFIPWPPKE